MCFLLYFYRSGDGDHLTIFQNIIPVLYGMNAFCLTPTTLPHSLKTVRGQVDVYSHESCPGGRTKRFTLDRTVAKSKLSKVYRKNSN